MNAYEIVCSLDQAPPDWCFAKCDELFWWVKRASDGACVSSDRGEPEDKTYVRNFRDIVEELNRVAKSLEEEIGV